MKKLFLSAFISALSFPIKAQIIAGPMLDQVELHDAKLWLQVVQEVRSPKLQYNTKGQPLKTKTLTYKGRLGKDFDLVQFTVGG